jgi:hypothetical protein
MIISITDRHSWLIGIRQRGLKGITTAGRQLEALNSIIPTYALGLKIVRHTFFAWNDKCIISLFT